MKLRSRKWHGRRIGLIISRLPFLLLLVRNPSRFSLTLLHFPQINPYRTASERVRLGRPPVLLVGCPEPPDQRIEAAPCLPQRARARGRRLRLTIKDAPLQVDFSLPKLIQVPHEIQHMVAVALAQRHRRPLVAQELPERVPISPLLRLVAAGSGGAACRIAAPRGPFC